MAADETRVTREAVLEQAERLRDRLVARLGRQRLHYAAMIAWYLGEQTPPGLPRDATGEIYRRIRETSRNTWASLLVDAIAERLEVQGYRSASGDRALEARAWEILQTNRVDSDQRQVYADALIGGRGYVLVAPDVDGDGEGPVVTPETPLEVTHLWAPGSRRRVRAAIKVYDLDGGWWRCELYTPDLAFAWEGEVGDEADRHPFDGKTSPWDDEAVVIAENELGVVNVVPFENRPLTAAGPVSEIEQVEHVLHRIDELLVGRQVASHFSAFRQKWATGLEVPRDPETNRPVEPYKAMVSRLWIAEDPESKFGSFEATDLGQYTRAIEAEVAELAAISRVPAHMLLSADLANPPSAESLVAAEAGLLKKCRDRQRSFGESWEQVARLALILDGTPRADVGRSDEVLWADPSVRAPAQIADAASKYKDVGVPREAVWAFLGATPQQIETWRAMAAEDDLRALELALPPAAA